MHIMEWDDLRYALALSRCGSLTAAADDLGVAHTTVSRRIGRLEAGVGARVFERFADGWVPTAAGEALMAAAERMEEQLLGVDSEVLGLDMRLTGPLRVASVAVFAAWFMDGVASFSRAYPGVDLEFVTGQHLHSLDRREADVVLRFTQSPPEHLFGRRAATISYCLYGATTLLDRVGRDKPLDEFPWICWLERLGATVTAAWMKANVPDARTALLVDTGVTMISAAEAGVGLTFLPCLPGDKSPLLERIGEVLPDFSADLWLLTHPNLKNTARVRAFITHMAEHIKSRKAELEGTLDLPR